MNKDLAALFHGVTSVEQTDGGLLPLRLTQAQRRWQAGVNEAHGLLADCAAGVSLEFYTAAEEISFRFSAQSYGNRDDVRFDVYENGLFRAHLAPTDGLFAYRKEAAGTAKLQIYCSNLTRYLFSDFSLGDWLPVSYAGKKLLLAYGDSITQGMLSAYPSVIWASALARLLDCRCVNRGICGDRYNAAFLDPEDSLRPDLVVTAYGTNDLNQSYRDMPGILAAARGYLLAALALYPAASHWVVTPTWFARRDEERDYRAAFDEYTTALKNICADLSVPAVDGLSLMGMLPGFCGDERVHPNALGHLSMASGIAKHIASA